MLNNPKIHSCKVYIKKAESDVRGRLQFSEEDGKLYCDFVKKKDDSEVMFLHLLQGLNISISNNEDASMLGIAGQKLNEDNTEVVLQAQDLPEDVDIALLEMAVQEFNEENIVEQVVEREFTGGIDPVVAPPVLSENSDQISIEALINNSFFRQNVKDGNEEKDNPYYPSLEWDRAK